MPIRLEVHDGHHTRSVRVPRADAVIGRARGSDVRLSSPGVSRRHARVRVVGDAIEVVDLGSRAGVLVRGTKVPSALVSVGESFTVCEARITLVEASLGVESDARSGSEVPSSTAPTRPAPASAAPRARRAVALAQAPLFDRNQSILPAPRPANDPRAERHLEFDELLYATLNRTPWYAISIGLHFVLLALLTVVDLGLSPPPRPPEDAVIALSDGTGADGLDDTIDELLVDDILEDMERLIPDDADVDTPFEPVPIEATEDEPDVEEMVPFVDAPAAALGIQDPSAASLGLLPTSTTNMKLGASFGKDEAGEANTLAARALRASPFTRQLLKGLRLRTSRVNTRVLRGEYDQCESVLDRLELEHDALLPGELELAAPGQEIRAIFYNCTSKPLSEAALDRIEGFVRNGGYLFTTDWGLENVLERRFSQYVRTLRDRGRVIMTDDETISFQAATKHPLLRGLPGGAKTSRWWLEDSSILIDVVAPQAVDVLIRSKELKSRYGSDVVAVTFKHGKGRVVHVLGHFFQKEGNLRGTVAMQRILLNFLYQALRN